MTDEAPKPAPYVEPLKVTAVKGVASFSAQNMMLQVIWFLTSLVVLNSITVADYSVMKLVFATVAVPAALYIAGIDSVLLADMGVEREHGRLGQVKDLFRAYVIFEMISAAVIWAGFILFFTFFGDVFSQATRSYLFIASFSIFSQPMQNILIQFFSLFFRFWNVTKVKLFNEGLTLLGIVIFVFFQHKGLYAIILIQVIAPFLAVLISLPSFFALYRKELRHVTPVHAGLFARLRAHGKWSIASAYVLKTWDAAHLFLIDRLIGREAVALYSLADSLWGHLISLFPIKSILDAMLPQRTKDETTARRNLVHGFKYAAIGFVLLGIASAIGGYPFLWLFFPKYVAAFPVFLGFLLMIPRFAFSSVLSPLLRAYKFQKSGFTAAVNSLVMTVVLAFVLFPVLGMAGAIIEVVVVSTVQVYIVYRTFIKKYPAFKLHLSELMTWDRYDADTIQTLVKGIRSRLRMSKAASGPQ